MRNAILANASRFDANTNFGKITAEKISLQGDITLDSGHGDIDLRNVILANASRLDANTDFGEITAEKISSQGDITLASEHGDIDLYDVNLTNASTFDVTTDFGSIKVEKISSQGDITLDTAHGTIDLRDVDLTNSIGIISGYGRIDLEQIVCTDISMEGIVGDIKFTDLDAQNITIAIRKPSDSRSNDARGGDVRGNIIGKQSDFSVTSRTDSGSNNLSNQAGSGSKMLNVSTYLGNIDISFTE